MSQIHRNAPESISGIGLGRFPENRQAFDFELHLQGQIPQCAFVGISGSFCGHDTFIMQREVILAYWCR
jgi:hypothetical protein